jgi:hypothetical protein
MTVDDVIALLGLRPHPEGGYYAETWRDATDGAERGAGSAILFLLPAGMTSAWHRIDAAEIWHHYAGAGVELSVALAGEPATTNRLGDRLGRGEMPQIVVPSGAWQRARSMGAWSLVGCTVSPAFTFDAFELAREGWSPEAGVAPEARDSP